MHYRYTLPGGYPPGMPGYKDDTARQGYYVCAESLAEAGAAATLRHLGSAVEVRDVTPEGVSIHGRAHIFHREKSWSKVTSHGEVTYIKTRLGEREGAP